MDNTGLTVAVRHPGPVQTAELRGAAPAPRTLSELLEDHLEVGQGGAVLLDLLLALAQLQQGLLLLAGDCVQLVQQALNLAAVE